jgi:uncharacterized phage protein gp47/JayE
MPIEIKTKEQIEQLLSNALIQAINVGQTDPSKKIDPTIRNGFIRGLVQSLSVGIFENNKNIQKAVDEVIPWTSQSEEYLQYWGNVLNINRQDSTPSTGVMIFTGTATTLIPQNTSITSATDIEYLTESDVTITLQNLNVASIVRVGSLVTVTTDVAHNLANNVIVTITGADQVEYNVVDQAINVISTTEFTFSIDTTPVTPATGTIVVSFTSASVTVNSVEFGTETNVGGNVDLTLTNPIIGVDSDVYTNFEGISGGLAVESVESYRNRIGEKFSSYFAPAFTTVGIPVFLKENVAGITRAWVKAAFPDPGKVTIYFVRDNDDDIIPNASQIADAKDAIINGTDTVDGIKPANTPDNYVIVLAPTPKTVNFHFTTLSPNTDDMKNAITQNLTDYFRNNAEFEQSISQFELNNIIYSTTDSNGNSPTFSLALSNVIVGAGEIPILGTVSF